MKKRKLTREQREARYRAACGVLDALEGDAEEADRRIQEAGGRFLMEDGDLETFDRLCLSLTVLHLARETEPVRGYSTAEANAVPPEEEDGFPF